jgi:hypothetical protein
LVKGIGLLVPAKEGMSVAKDQGAGTEEVEEEEEREEGAG